MYRIQKISKILTPNLLFFHRQVHTPSTSTENYYENVKAPTTSLSLDNLILNSTQSHYSSKEVSKMISKNLGSYLKFLSSNKEINKILELGTFTGYSSSYLISGMKKSIKILENFNNLNETDKIWSCETRNMIKEYSECKSVGDEGLIKEGWGFDIKEKQKLFVGVDINLEALKIAESYLTKERNKDLEIKLINQDIELCLLNIPKELKFDLIFLDANKSKYWAYYDLIIEEKLLTKNGLLIIDNVLFHGEVPKIEDNNNNNNVKKGIAYKLNEFNKKVINDQRTNSFLLPSWDGIMLVKYN
ncbi:hypothetical protein K502DRAFT_111016 [Neoconidiobolus thromboides FSU 785]|nr:hypothetical protein K502DRAFT_111016 [Neoconidiobolus thromboides FSU 785]